jgi:hypothetical protein
VQAKADPSKKVEADRGMLSLSGPAPNNEAKSYFRSKVPIDITSTFNFVTVVYWNHVLRKFGVCLV